MNIAIIGTGNIGSGLATVLAKSRHGVVVADRKGGAELAAKLKGQGLLVQAADIKTAVASSEVVILAVPYGAVASLANEADFSGRVVIDVSNPVTEDFSGLQIGHDSSAAEEIARQLPGASVVKAFNTVFAQHYGTGLKIAGKPLQTFVATDDEAARDTVKSLAAEMGLEPVDAGPLKNARYLEPLGFLNIQFGYVLGRGTEIAPQLLAA